MNEMLVWQEKDKASPRWKRSASFSYLWNYLWNFYHERLVTKTTESLEDWVTVSVPSGQVMKGS